MALFETTNLIQLFISIVSVVVTIIPFIILLNNYWKIDKEKTLINEYNAKKMIKEDIPKLTKIRKVNLLHYAIGEISINRYIKDEEFSKRIDYLLLTNKSENK